MVIPMKKRHENNTPKECEKVVGDDEFYSILHTEINLPSKSQFQISFLKSVCNKVYFGILNFLVGIGKTQYAYTKEVYKVNV